MSHIENATIDSVRIGFDREVFLTCWIYLSLSSGGSQGFGGYVLGGNILASPDIPCSQHDTQPNFAADWISHILGVAGVDDVSKLVGKNVRVERESDTWSSKITGVGHIIKDLWFRPEERLKNLTASDCV